MSNRTRSIGFLLAPIVLAVACAGGAGTTRSKLDVWEQKEIAEQAYVYAFPMLAAYKALYQFNVDTRSSQYKGPFNTIAYEARVFTPKDTAIVTPNSDTPYSMVQMDLRTEPIVLCVPAVEKQRYYSIQSASRSIAPSSSIPPTFDRYLINSPMLAGVVELCGFRTDTCPPGMKPGDAISPPDGYVGGGLQLQVDAQIGPAGDVWVTNNWQYPPAALGKVDEALQTLGAVRASWSSMAWPSR